MSDYQIDGLNLGGLGAGKYANYSFEWYVAVGGKVCVGLISDMFVTLAFQYSAYWKAEKLRKYDR